MEHKAQLENALKKLIKKEGLDEITIRKKIAFAISLALKSNNINQQDFLSKIPCQGNSPTIEEITDYMIIELAQDE